MSSVDDREITFDRKRLRVYKYFKNLLHFRNKSAIIRFRGIKIANAGAGCSNHPTPCNTENAPPYRNEINPHICRYYYTSLSGFCTGGILSILHLCRVLYVRRVMDLNSITRRFLCLCELWGCDRKAAPKPHTAPVQVRRNQLRLCSEYSILCLEKANAMPAALPRRHPTHHMTFHFCLH
jgi:hypothetical protein